MVNHETIRKNKKFTNTIMATTLIILLGLLILLILLAVQIFIPLNTEKSNHLNDFNSIKSSLFNGTRLRVVIHYAYMNLYINGTKYPSPDAVSGLDISEYEYFNRNVTDNQLAYIATSQAQLILHPRYGGIYNYGKIRIYEDNTIEVAVTYLNAANYDIVFQETFNSSLSNNSVFFFSQVPLNNN